MIRPNVRTRFAALTMTMAASFAFAPVQCAHDPDPNRRMEEEPAQGLYDLAQKFRAEGNEAARRETLAYIVERYPASRFANMAKLDLEQMGGPAPSSSPNAGAAASTAPRGP